MNDKIIHLTLEKARTLDEARSFLADCGVIPVTQATASQMRVVPHVRLANGARWIEPIPQQGPAKTVKVARRHAKRRVYPTSVTRLTSEQQTRLVTLWEVEKLGGTEIAKQLGCMREAVYRYARLLNLSKRPSFFGTPREQPRLVQGAL